MKLSVEGQELISYEYNCPHCNGDKIIEHIEEGISEDCEHCNGTGRKSKLTDSQVMGKNIIIGSLNTHPTNNQ